MMAFKDGVDFIKWLKSVGVPGCIIVAILFSVGSFGLSYYQDTKLRDYVDSNYTTTAVAQEAVDQATRNAKAINDVADAIKRVEISGEKVEIRRLHRLYCLAVKDNNGEVRDSLNADIDDHQKRYKSLTNNGRLPLQSCDIITNS